LNKRKFEKVQQTHIDVEETNPRFKGNSVISKITGNLGTLKSLTLKSLSNKVDFCLFTH
jgi:hypothetical protein